MRLRSAVAVVVLLLAGRAASVHAEVVIETVTVGNPGNADDTHGDGYGGVDYVYQIGTFEVTAGQYTEFLNAVAGDDTYELYKTRMWSNEFGCKIERTGSSPNYRYSVAPDWADRPVNYVDWGDAARFCNWLHNGQPMGAQDLFTTEDGSYYLNGAMTDDELIAIVREPDARWVIPSEDEWYKAAYHYNDGVTGNYYDYPTSSDSVPSNDLIDPDPGNNATFYAPGDYTIGSPYWRTEAGAHENSESPYDTFDQGGNVKEWNEAIIDSFRGLRGGGFGLGIDYFLHAAYRASVNPTNEYITFGFRVAEVEPWLGCGDGVIEGPEECDDAGESATCDADCTVAECGDGTLNATAGEQCDDAVESVTCDSDCTIAECGDATHNVTAGEECDDGSGNSDTDADACRTDCTAPSCADGVVDTGEECDDAGESPTCDADCTVAECGDGTLNATAGEECDDAGDSLTCDSDCTIAECGDGTLNVTAGEECDDGSGNTDTEPDACRTDCRQPWCGDGVVDTAEECDDGNTEPYDGCDESCQIEFGACCLGTACSATVQVDCSDSGGVFFGYNSTCDAPDADGDGLRDECDGCPDDANKIEPGECGCGVDEVTDGDADGVPDCGDECPGVDDAIFAPGCDDAIPTVSTWGLVILGLLLLVGHKIHFSRRTA